MSRLMLLSCLMLLGVGCAGTKAHTRAGESALPLGYRGGEPLVVDGAFITGPTSSLIIDDNAMRGRFRDIPVSLAWTWQELTGTVGPNTTKLELAEGDDTRVWGSFAGMPVDFILEGDWLYGRVGTCLYVMQRNEGGFKGRSNCGNPLEEYLQVAFPAPLLERPLGEKAALMTLMLANVATMNSPTVGMARFTRPRSVIDAPVKNRRY
ncbi:hypothetical protein F0U61_46485 [Archangium violaceum]|uniref:hypothetical protein n=1 Tax=Archangium violaceum TaxID=83451 RepID=UPI002B2AA48E|nr:hypothetical protein F0U61_46485 [Archangium violaceum]